MTGNDEPPIDDGTHNLSREHREPGHQCEWGCPDYRGNPPGVESPQRCPDCVAGKHAVCNGVAWDKAEDDIGDCECSCGGAERMERPR